MDFYCATAQLTTNQYSCFSSSTTFYCQQETQETQEMKAKALITSKRSYSHLLNTSPGRDNSQGWVKVENQGLNCS